MSSDRKPSVAKQINEQVSTSKTDICEACGKKAYANERLFVDNKTFHKTCFRCALCNKLIKIESFHQVDGKYYCIVDFKRIQFASRTPSSSNLGSGSPATPRPFVSGATSPRTSPLGSPVSSPMGRATSLPLASSRTIFSKPNVTATATATPNGTANSTTNTNTNTNVNTNSNANSNSQQESQACTAEVVQADPTPSPEELAEIERRKEILRQIEEAEMQEYMLRIQEIRAHHEQLHEQEEERIRQQNSRYGDYNGGDQDGVTGPCSSPTPDDGPPPLSAQEKERLELLRQIEEAEYLERMQLLADIRAHHEQLEHRSSTDFGDPTINPDESALVASLRQNQLQYEKEEEERRKKILEEEEAERRRLEEQQKRDEEAKREKERLENEQPVTENILKNYERTYNGFDTRQLKVISLTMDDRKRQKRDPGVGAEMSLLELPSLFKFLYPYKITSGQLKELKAALDRLRSSFSAFETSSKILVESLAKAKATPNDASVNRGNMKRIFGDARRDHGEFELASRDIKLLIRNFVKKAKEAQENPAPDTTPASPVIGGPAAAAAAAVGSPPGSPGLSDVIGAASPSLGPRKQSSGSLTSDPNPDGDAFNESIGFRWLNDMISEFYHQTYCTKLDPKVLSKYVLENRYNYCAPQAMNVYSMFGGKSSYFTPNFTTWCYKFAQQFLADQQTSLEARTKRSSDQHTACQ